MNPNDEKVLIKGDFMGKSTAFTIIGLGFVMNLVSIISAYYIYLTGEFPYYSRHRYYKDVYDSFLDFAFNKFWAEGFGYWLIFSLLLLLIGGILYALMSCQLVVTNKRVYGKVAFGKRVDLPINHISALGLGIFKCITVSTSSGTIHFWFMRNREKVHKVISSQFATRQEEKKEYAKPAPVAAPAPASKVEEMKQYKELLDMGIITQAEFDAKKKEILGL